MGIYIPLIVVNCIILGRAEAFACKNSPFDSILDGIGCGIGFTFALTLLGMVRELLGNGTLFGISILPETTNILLFVLQINNTATGMGAAVAFVLTLATAP